MRARPYAFLLMALLAPLALADEGGLFGRKKPANEDTWAIRCITDRGPDRVRNIDLLAGALRQVKGLDAKLVVAIHGDEESSLYYGRYERTFNSAREQHEYKPDPSKALELIRALNVANSRLAESDPNNWPFRFATIAQLPVAAATEGRPEWNLENVSGSWSVHVAVFYNNDKMTQRKTAAVEYCALLRSQGVEAYYHHGEDKSSVSVGVFPRDSVAVVEETDPYTGNLNVKYVIVDKRIEEVMRAHPHSYENGYLVSIRKQDPASPGGYKKIPTPSFIIRLPKAARDREKGH
jgi:hypothetical protein